MDIIKKLHGLPPRPRCAHGAIASKCDICAIAEAEARIPVWKPIETAPKDGREILCFCPNIDDDEPGIRIARWLKEAGDWDTHACDWGLNCDFTYWMPLPDYPN